jgi:hypothetical protein
MLYNTCKHSKHFAGFYSYIRKIKKCKTNSSVPIGSLTEQSDPVGDKTRITNVVPQKGR